MGVLEDFKQKVQGLLNREEENLWLLKEKLRNQDKSASEKEIEQLKNKITDAKARISEYEEGLETAIKDLQEMKEVQMKIRDLLT